MERITMKDLPKEQRPYEKCMAYGPKALTDSELLAVIIRTGSSERTSLELADAILSQNAPGDGLTGLLHCSLEQLQSIRGVGPVKGIQLLCIGELSRRIWKQKVSAEPVAFTQPDQIADYYMERLRHEDQEVLLCMMLDTKNQLLGEKEITRGTVNATMISPRELFLAALQFRAVHILLVHNHPSGIPEPSGDDITVTRQIRRAGEMLGITLLDHIIIGDHCYTSMLEQGI